MGEESTDTPESGTTEPAAAPATPPAPNPKSIDRLPEDHPLVTAFERTKAELADARKKVQEFEDRNKTEGEKLTDRLTAAETRAQDAELRALRLEVAASKGLTPTQAKRLVGKTRDELEADADEIIEAFPPKQPAAPPSSRPSATARGGTDPTSPPEPSVDELVASVLGG
jgi:hypothetical protein